MEFDKNKLMNNINTLIKEQGKKIGELEAAIGVSKGYLSRMSKSENETMPGVDLIYKLAQQFDVSVEALVNGDFNKSNDNLLFLIKFLHILQQDTDLHDIEWEFFRVYEELQDKYAFDNLPMITRTLEVVLDEGTSAYKFESQFSVDANLTMTKENFCGFSSVGVLLVFKLLNHLPGGEKQTEYEIYAIEDRGGGEEPLVPICSTLDRDGEIRPYVSDFYNCLLKHSKDLRVSEEARNLINRYFDKRNSEPLPFD